MEEVSEKNMKRIKEKKLYLSYSDLKDDIDTVEKLKKIYNYRAEITTKEKIEQVIKDQDADAVVTKVINYKNLKFVLFIAAKNSELMYGRVMTGFNQMQIGPKFFKDINE